MRYLSLALFAGMALIAMAFPPMKAKACEYPAQAVAFSYPAAVTFQPYQLVTPFFLGTASVQTYANVANVRLQKDVVVRNFVVKEIRNNNASAAAASASGASAASAGGASAASSGGAAASSAGGRSGGASASAVGSRSASTTIRRGPFGGQVIRSRSR